MAADICPERYGSSPEPSETRPQRGSAETSHIGENVHEDAAKGSSNLDDLDFDEDDEEELETEQEDEEV